MLLARRRAPPPFALGLLLTCALCPFVGLPLALQPALALLVPRLVEGSAHTAAAGALLGRLAEAHRQGPEPEAALRVPVLAALGALRIDPALAEKVLGAALEARPQSSRRCGRLCQPGSRAFVILQVGSFQKTRRSWCETARRMPQLVGLRASH